jgi:hypothetical protein|tara:strand:- start:83 stop:793 length:711 start_codon:yes stop_codon:yes gene_type:complete
MAKVQFGGGVSNIQGSIAGNTFTRSKAGPAVRNKVKPNNPATPAQMAQRELITRLSKSWQSIAEDDRKAWDAAASETKTKGVCGNNIEMTGHQYFVRVNSLREANGDATDANIIPAAAEFTADIFLTPGEAQVEIAANFVKVLLGTGAAEGQRVAIWATAARSAGKMAYKGVMKKTTQKALTADDITNTYVDMVVDWVDRFGTLTGTAGKAITFGARQYTDGTYSNSVISKAVISA